MILAQLPIFRECGQAKPVSVLVAALFFLSLVASLFFNGMQGQYFSLSMSLLMVAVSVAVLAGAKARADLPKTPLLLSLLAYVGWLVLSVLWSPIPYLSITYCWLLSVPLLILFILYLMPDGNLVWRYIWQLLFVVGVGLMGMGLYQYFWLDHFPTATFINKNSLAAALVALVFVAISRAVLAMQHWGFFVFLTTASLLIGLIGSRGAFLGLALGLVVLLALAIVIASVRRSMFINFLAVAIGLVVSNLPIVNLRGSLITDRLEALSDPYSAGSDRFLIWQQSLNMALSKPLEGFGLGTYWQFWPQWRDPADGTSGFWAHNDFLHLWVEGGLIAVVLLLLVHVLVARAVWQIVKSSKRSESEKVESVVLFAGLLAVAIHAQFTFNYYNLPILIMLSLMLARISRIWLDSAACEVRRLSVGAARFAIPAATFFAIIYFGMTGWSQVVFENAIKLMRSGQFQEAEQQFVRAQSLWGGPDMFYYTHGLLKEQQFVATPAENVVVRQQFFAEGMALFERAINISSVRPVPYFLRARLRVQAAELAGESWLADAESDFKQALAVDPRYIEARVTLANIYAVTNRQGEADALLEQGSAQLYNFDTPSLLTYYQMLIQARLRAGDVVAINEVVERYNQVRAHLRH